MGELIEMGRVVFDGNDPRAPRRESPRVIQMPKRELSVQEKALQPLLKELDEVENFVVFAHTKTGGFKIVPCLDPDLSLWMCSAMRQDGGSGDQVPPLGEHVIFARPRGRRPPPLEGITLPADG